MKKGQSCEADLLLLRSFPKQISSLIPFTDKEGSFDRRENNPKNHLIQGLIVQPLLATFAATRN